MPEFNKFFCCASLAGQLPCLWWSRLPGPEGSVADAPGYALVRMVANGGRAGRGRYHGSEVAAHSELADGTISGGRFCGLRVVAWLAGPWPKRGRNGFGSSGLRDSILAGRNGSRRRKAVRGHRRLDRARTVADCNDSYRARGRADGDELGPVERVCQGVA